VPNSTANQKITLPEQNPVVIGIGASAGGLEALEQFFQAVPEGCNAAFVVIQHLDPTQPGMLPELLQRFTAMTVMQASDDLKIESNHVYVIPPNKDLSILQGNLHLIAPTEPRGLRLPIDLFFKSLAEDQCKRAIGIILSGMGSDGTLGLRSIKDNGGLCLVQSPESAKFDSMPLSAIHAGLADKTTTPQELWQEIAHYLKNEPSARLATAQPILSDTSKSALEQIILLLKDRTGNDFSFYKKNTLNRRVDRRMDLHRIDVIDNYVRYLRNNPQELDLLFNELLIGVTQFFRDPLVWDQLKSNLLSSLFSQYPAGKALRAWVPACSTGEEAYSLAILFKEALSESNLEQHFTLQIFATDLDMDSVQTARKGFYPISILQGKVSEERLGQFFVAEDKGYRINADIREMVIFARQNIISDPPFTRLDLLICRNLLIYFNPQLQKKLLPLFHYALASRGILMLGSAESIGDFTSMFRVLDSQARLFQRIDQPGSLSDIHFPIKQLSAVTMNDQPNPAQNDINLQSEFEQLLLQNFSPPALLVNSNGDIIFINGHTGKYLDPASGKANLNVHALTREELRYDLGHAITKAQQQTEAVILQGLKFSTNGSTHNLDITVKKISKPAALNGLLIIIFKDSPQPAKRKRARNSPDEGQQHLIAELHQAREDLQTLAEERQTSQEELKSTNEELQSTNEELQSTNEELTTSKEEMQSMNEELQTMNMELQSKVTDLSWVNNDMTNLLNSMEIATVFLDNALNIRRFTSHCTRLFKLIAGDVGRPLSDIVTDLDYPELQTDSQEVLSSLVFVEKQVKTHDDRWYKVRIMPYRTQDNVIDGLVITFIDISATKNLEAQLRSQTT